ncbi:hypothetical protein H0H87_009894 [Tephrocybe sp. NHM501043]|nr:hypothetical protein H0H87_009894 [Tephrocybe sp. NHM501043]
MPSTLCTLVPAFKSTWKMFCDAVKAVDIADMKEMKEKKQHTKKLEDKIWDLKAKAATPPTPSKTLAVTQISPAWGSDPSTCLHTQACHH